MRWLVSLLFVFSVLGAPEGPHRLGEGPGTDTNAAISAPETGERAPAEVADEDSTPDAVATGAVVGRGHRGRAASFRSGADHLDSVIALVPLPPPIA